MYALDSADGSVEVGVPADRRPHTPPQPWSRRTACWSRSSSARPTGCSTGEPGRRDVVDLRHRRPHPQLTGGGQAPSRAAHRSCTSGAANGHVVAVNVNDGSGAGPTTPPPPSRHWRPATSSTPRRRSGTKGVHIGESGRCRLVRALRLPPAARPVRRACDCGPAQRRDVLAYGVDVGGPGCRLTVRSRSALPAT